MECLDGKTIKKATKTNLARPWKALAFLFLTHLILPASAQTELILNGGFESGSGTSVPNWTVAGGAALNGAPGSSAYAHSGSHYMILGGTVNEADHVYQTIGVPSTATTVTLSFWENITSAETTTTTAYDTMTVTIRNTTGTILLTIANYSNLNKDSALGIWHQKTADLSAYKGQTIEVYFASSNDSSLVTSFDIDDVSVQATVPGPAPSISSVSPNPVTGTNGVQPFYINGANFVSGCNVTLRDLTAGQIFANRTIVSFSSMQIELTPNFTTAMDSWSVEVINPDGQSSGQLLFNVALPNLVPQSITLSTNSMIEGGTLTVTWTLANTASGNSPGTVTGVRINKSTSSYSGTTFTNVPMPALSGNSSTRQSAQLSVPNAPGTYYVWIIADNVSSGAISQSNYSDDEQHSTALTVTGSSTGTNLVFGLDTSTIQQGGTIDWNAVKSSSITYNAENYPVTFAILRASKGNANIDDCRFTDTYFAARAAAAGNAGLSVGAYHVASVTNKNTGEFYSAISEADYFVQVAGNWIKPGNMRPFLDVEDHSCGTLSTYHGLTNWVDQWMQEVKDRTGVAPIIYCDTTLANMLQSLASKYDLWYVPPCAPSTTCDLASSIGITPWNTELVQYSWSGASIGMNADLDVFQGTQSAFQSKVIIPNAGSNGGLGPVISNPKLSGTTFTISVPTQGGSNYVLEFKSTLNDANWTPIQTNGGNGGQMTMTNTGVTGPSRVYRVRVE